MLISVAVAPAAAANACTCPEAAEEVWRSLSPLPDSLGGRTSPDRLRGYACPACADALDAIGAVGPTAMERSFLAHLRASAGVGACGLITHETPRAAAAPAG